MPGRELDEPCDEQAAAGVTVIVSEQIPGEAYVAGKEVARTTTDDDGTFTVASAPASTS